jgi:hypothetical protein
LRWAQQYRKNAQNILFFMLNHYHFSSFSHFLLSLLCYFIRWSVRYISWKAKIPNPIMSFTRVLLAASLLHAAQNPLHHSVTPTQAEIYRYETNILSISTITSHLWRSNSNISLYSPAQAGIHFLSLELSRSFTTNASNFSSVTASWRSQRSNPQHEVFIHL